MIDLRSDAVTQPTEAMWEAMRAAPPSWSAGGDDPSVLALEARAVALTGKQAALFVPTGTMANLLTLMGVVERGAQVILEASSHMLWSEEWSLSYICGAHPRPIAGTAGVIAPDVLRHTLRERRFSHRPRTDLICLENTHNAAGGTVLLPAQQAALAAVAHEHNVPLHLDGARLFNAQVTLGVSLRDLVADVDSVALSLSKGLSAPGGALLCGSAALIERSRMNLKRLGAHSLTNAGIYAAAALVALDTMVPQLAEDHRRARALATGLIDVPGLAFDLACVQTNVVMLRLTGPLNAVQLAEQMLQRGIRTVTYSDDVMRLVLHRHIDDVMVAQTIAVIQELLYV